jgi:hypothetical protein
LRLWIEGAHQSLVGTGNDVIRTFQTEEQFHAVVASGLGIRYRVLGTEPIAQEVMSLLEQGVPLGKAVEAILVALPENEHVPFSILQVVGGTQGNLVECDAPPLFMARRGELVLLPVIEEESRGHLIRQCQFALEDGDHLAIVSEGYIHAKGWSRQWGWRDIAVSIRRLTETRCDAEQLLGALVRSHYRLAGDTPDTQSPISISILAMFVRPMRTATVWSGPPVEREVEEEIVEKLIDEPGARIICGDTTAEIAARLLGAELEMEPRPEDGWMEVPPVSRLRGRPGIERIDLITEGLVTMGKARERILSAQRARDLPRKEDGATRLARALLTTDKIHFLVGLAVNPAQTTDTGVPLRRIVIEDLMNDLKARGKIVSVEYF